MQNNTMKWLTGRYNSSVQELLTLTKWMSVYQMSVYYSLILYWKVHYFKKPRRLVERVQNIKDSIARMLLTDRIWSRTTERNFKLVENKCSGVDKISVVKRIFGEWVK